MVAWLLEHTVCQFGPPQRVLFLVSTSIALLLLGLEGAATGRTAQAATTVFVTNTSDSGPGSLRDAISQSQSGDTIAFAIPPAAVGCTAAVCTISLTSGELVVSTSLSIVGPGATLLTVRRQPGDDTPHFRIFSIAEQSDVTIAGLTIANGSAPAGPGGGGIYNRGSLTVRNSIVTGNSAMAPSDREGGGILNSGSLAVANSTVSENISGLVGGGIASTFQLDMVDSTIHGNHALIFGGGLDIDGEARIRNSTIDANTAPSIGGRGAGINVQAGSVTLDNVTVSGNQAGGIGGALRVGHDGVATLVNSTFSGNVAALGASVIDGIDADSVILKNSIIAAGAAVPGREGCVAVITRVGNNLSDDATCGPISADLRLGALADNGGFTRTHQLQAGSAAIDAGASGGCTDSTGQPLLTDQRGVPRPLTGRCDLGAFESLPEDLGLGPPAIATISPQVSREDTTLEPFDFQVADSDRASTAAHLTVVARSSNQSLVPDGNIVVAPSTGPGGVRRLTATPLANANGTATVTLTVTDAAGRSATTSFPYTVLAVNDRPSFAKGLDVMVAQDSGKFGQEGWAHSIVAGPPNESRQTVAFQLSADRPDLFAGAGTRVNVSPNGTLTFTPAAGVAGIATVTVTLQDSGGTTHGGLNLSASTTFKIAITPTDQPPIAKDDSYAVAFNTALTIGAPGVLANDADPEGRALTVTPVKQPTSGTLALNLNGGFTYTPTTGYSGPDSFTYRASDGTNTSGPATVSLTVAGPAQPQTCVPAPPPTLRTEQVGPGRLRVTVTVRTNAGTPSNTLTALVFGQATNARIEVAGQPAGQTDRFTLTLPAGTITQSFFVQRVGTGPFKVDLGIVDGCHGTQQPFRTFVGGGTGVQ